MLRDLLQTIGFLCGAFGLLAALVLASLAGCGGGSGDEVGESFIVSSSDEKPFIWTRNCVAVQGPTTVNVICTGSVTGEDELLARWSNGVQP